MRKIMNIVTETISPQWPETLSDADAITDYIAGIAPGHIDYELIRDYFRGCRAVLKLVNVLDLEPGNADNNIPNKSKERKYSKMDISTMPPLVIEDNKIIDGNHRYRVAINRGLTEILCYVVEEANALEPILEAVDNGWPPASPASPISWNIKP